MAWVDTSALPATFCIALSAEVSPPTPHLPVQGTYGKLYVCALHDLMLDGVEFPAPSPGTICAWSQ